MGIIDRIKKKKELLDKEREKKELLYKRNMIYRFYEQSLQISKASSGMVYLITPDEVLVEDAGNEQNHKSVCEYLLSKKYNKEVVLDNDGDYGQLIADEYNIIFIRMVSIINNVSIINYPKEVNEYQLNEFKKFKSMVDEYNDTHKDLDQAKFIFKDYAGEESDDLDKLINDMENGVGKNMHP